MGQALCRGELVLEEEGLWFIKREEGGGKILLPEHLFPLIIKHKEGALFQRLDEVDARYAKPRYVGLVVLYHCAKHGSRRRVRWWSICPRSALELDLSRARLQARKTGYRQCPPRALRRAS